MQVPAGEDAAPEVPARAFRVVCDSMLQGLARRLRCLGIDVLVLATGEDHRRAAEVGRPPASAGRGGSVWGGRRAPAAWTPTPLGQRAGPPWMPGWRHLWLRHLWSAGLEPLRILWGVA